MGLSRYQKRILRAMAEGWTLKSHRFVSGLKYYRLHALDGRTVPARWRAVRRLMDGGYIHSNQKFPAATYLLTDTGREVVAGLREGEIRPLGARNFFR